jgi:O-antigen/teichoic acid export membrane protein
VVLVAAVGLSVTTALPLAWVGPYLPAAVVALVWLGGLVRRAERAAGLGSAERAAGLGSAGGLEGAERAAAGAEHATGGPVTSMRAELGPFWRYTGPRSLSALAQAAVQRLDIVLVATLRSTAEAAVYTAATRFMTLGQLSAQAVSTAVQHRIAERMARDDLPGVARLYQAATGWVVLLAWPAYLLFAAYAGPVLALFGPDYAAGRGVTTILACTMLLATGCGMVDAVLNMAGRTAWTFYNALAAVAVNVVLDLLLIPGYGIVGAALAWSAAIVVGNLVPLGQLYWAMRLHPFGRGTLVAAALGVACFGVPAGVSRLAGGGLAVLVPLTVVGALAYAVAAWRLRRLLELDGLRRVRAARRGSPGPVGADG